MGRSIERSSLCASSMSCRSRQRCGGGRPRGAFCAPHQSSCRSRQTYGGGRSREETLRAAPFPPVVRALPYLEESSPIKAFLGIHDLFGRVEFSNARVAEADKGVVADRGRKCFVQRHVSWWCVRFPTTTVRGAFPRCCGA